MRNLRTTHILTALAGVVTTAGCFDPDYGKGGFSCYDDECPEGYICVQETDGKVCRHKDHLPTQDAGIEDIGPDKDASVDANPPAFCTEPEILGPLVADEPSPFDLVITDQNHLSVVFVNETRSPVHLFKPLDEFDNPDAQWKANPQLSLDSASQVALAADHMKRIHLFAIDDGNQLAHLWLEGAPVSPWQGPFLVMLNLPQLFPNKELVKADRLDAHGFENHLGLVVSGVYLDSSGRSTPEPGEVVIYAPVIFDPGPNLFFYDAQCFFELEPGSPEQLDGPRVAMGPDYATASFFRASPDNNTIEWVVTAVAHENPDTTADPCGRNFFTKRNLPAYGDMAVSNLGKMAFGTMVEGSHLDPGPLFFTQWNVDGQDQLTDWQHLDPEFKVHAMSLDMILDHKDKPVVSYIGRGPEPPEEVVKLAFTNSSGGWQHPVVATGGESLTRVLRDDGGRLHILFDTRQGEKRLVNHVSCSQP